MHDNARQIGRTRDRHESTYVHHFLRSCYVIMSHHVASRSHQPLGLILGHQPMWTGPLCETGMDHDKQRRETI